MNHHQVVTTLINVHDSIWWFTKNIIAQINVHFESHGYFCEV
jgi:hypothetical protein